MHPIYLTHSEPLLRDRSDFLLQARVEGEENTFEQLWTRRIDSDHFEVCCVPFFLYDIALGDVVQWSENDRVAITAQPSGRYVLRVAFHVDAGRQAEWCADLESMSARIERSSSSMVALDLENEETAAAVSGALISGEQLGELEFETGKN